MELEQNAEKAKIRDNELSTKIVELERSTKESEKRFAKLEQKSSKDNGTILDPMSEHNSTQTQRRESKSLTEPESSITSLPQDVIDDNTAETLDFVETVYKEQGNAQIHVETRSSASPTPQT
ncbi:8219_t:CDS:2, partial [Acaulospora morrowiae]